MSESTGIYAHALVERLKRENSELKARLAEIAEVANEDVFGSYGEHSRITRIRRLAGSQES